MLGGELDGDLRKSIRDSRLPELEIHSWPRETWFNSGGYLRVSSYLIAKPSVATEDKESPLILHECYHVS